MANFLHLQRLANPSQIQDKSIWNRQYQWIWCIEVGEKTSSLNSLLFKQEEQSTTKDK